MPMPLCSTALCTGREHSDGWFLLWMGKRVKLELLLNGKCENSYPMIAFPAIAQPFFFFYGFTFDATLFCALQCPERIAKFVEQTKEKIAFSTILNRICRLRWDGGKRKIEGYFMSPTLGIQQYMCNNFKINKCLIGTYNYFSFVFIHWQQTCITYLYTHWKA